MNKAVPARTIFSSPVHFLAFGFGSGLAPWAPGTAGTLVAVFLEWPLRSQGFEVRLLVAVLLFASGVWICGESSRRLGVHDHGGIVWDEIAGYFLTMLLAPSGWLWSALGFILFRLFDIFKPWPIRQIDHRLGGGLGIMVDDTVAGVFAGLILWGLVQLHLFT
ncbi:MAG: phosphatidylglycerophosphatase A, partial [Gammaproteobacteria bacterium]|nr:phosphatidylglycerophosphatase A [Gammaproteobacteria bacterium]